MSNNSSSTRNFIPMANKYDRVVLLVDMDCFYCQVEEKLDPSLKNKPLAVVQYNAWRGGGIIAVNYAARAKGVTRHMRGDEAKEQCPDIQLVKVPNVRDKADLTKYRDAGKEVANVLQRFTPLLERASVDEAYLDITNAVNKRLQEMNDGTFILQPQELVNTYACGFPTIGEFVTKITSCLVNPPTDDEDLNCNFNETDVLALRQSNIRLLIAASIASEIRAAVKADTTYECSAGIAHNKILAKLACGINKPNKQTLLPLAQIPLLFETLPISKIKGLGAKFGEEVCERMGVRYLGQLLQFTEAELQRKFDEKNGCWLYNICRGIDLESVTPRFYSKSIGCCKKFPGRNNITGLKTLQHWLNELGSEINDRLEKDICENNRRAKQMVVNFIQEIDGAEISSSRSAPLQCYDTEVLAKTSFETIKGNTKQFFRAGSESVLNNPIKFLGISVGKFETISHSQNNIQEMFAQQAAKKKRLSADDKQDQETTANCSSSSVNVTESTDQEVSKEIEKIKESPIQIPKEKKKQDVRSFFFNALKKQSQTETIAPINQNRLNNNATTIDLSVAIAQSTSSSSTRNETQLRADPETDCTLTEKRIFSFKENVTETPPKSFFAQALKKKTESIRELTTTTDKFDKCIDVTKDSIDILESEVSKKNCNELNDLINVINTIQNEEEDNETYKEPVITNNVTVKNSKTLTNKRTYDTICDSNEQNLTDYRSQYVEFATPEFLPELLQYLNCSTCGAKILNDPLSVQTHQDRHFAQEINQKQRDEYRTDIRTKMYSSKSPPNAVANKKLKKIQQLNNNLKKSLHADITKFLKPSSSSVPLSQSNQNQETQFDLAIVEICDICNVPVKRDDILEHKDFHMAKELQRKLNHLEVKTVQVLKKPISVTSRKSMNSSTSSSSRKEKVVTKPISKFFTQPQI